jgi:tetratricopeptide (TPR) repeat protein
MRTMEWERDQAFAEFQPALSKVEEEAAQMYSRDDRKVFLVLLAEAKSRIFADYQRASGKLKTLLLNLMTRLIDSQLTVKAALRAARLNYNCSPDFQRVTGMRPRDYVEYHRLRLAQGILRYTDVRLYTVANTVGYNYQSQLSKNFGKKLGHRPKEEPKADPDEVRALLKGMPTELLNPGSLPDPGRSPNTAEETIAGSTAADMEEFWAEASRMNGDELKRYMFRQANAISFKHFHFLVEKAKYEGRVDRKRGVELAHSALDALNLVESWTGEVYTDERTFGYAVIGNHHRLDFDLEESDKWFRRATRLLPAALEENPLLFAEVNQLRVSLLWWQRHVGEAIQLFNVVLPIIREHGSSELLARTLQLGGDIYLSTDHTDRAAPLFLEAVELARSIDDNYVVFSAHYNLTYLYAKTSQPAMAQAQYEEVKKLRPTVQVSQFQIAYLKGLVYTVNGRYDAAEAWYLEAAEGFVAQGLGIFAAIASLELSLIYLQQGKEPKAFSTASNTIPIISQYSCHKEAISALALLQEAARAQCIDKAAVRKALHHLELIRRNPTAKFLTPCQRRGRA